MKNSNILNVVTSNEILRGLVDYHSKVIQLDYNYDKSLYYSDLEKYGFYSELESHGAKELIDAVMHLKNHGIPLPFLDCNILLSDDVLTERLSKVIFVAIRPLL